MSYIFSQTHDSKPRIEVTTGELTLFVIGVNERYNSNNARRPVQHACYITSYHFQERGSDQPSMDSSLISHNSVTFGFARNFLRALGFVDKAAELEKIGIRMGWDDILEQPSLF